MAAKDASKPTCGIVMPISALDGCSEEHWTEVHDILNEAIDIAGFEPNLVSNADDIGIIQKRIIQNLYDNPIVVCDVSGKNPNVMFELGLRLAFDRPTIIVKDDKTSYSFDTSPIEHLEYPRDLRFTRIVEFRAKLADKIKNTHQKASTDPNYTTFLKNFGEFKVAKIDQKEVTPQEFIIDELKSLRMAVARLDVRGDVARRSPTMTRSGGEFVGVCGKGLTKKELQDIGNDAIKNGQIVLYEIVNRDSDDKRHLDIEGRTESETIADSESAQIYIGGKIKGLLAKKNMRKAHEPPSENGR
jgi:hypothetical protein